MKAAWCGALLIVAAGALQSAFAGEEPALHLVVANADGTHASVSFPLSDAQGAAARHLWVWTDTRPPQKFDLTNGVPTKATLLEELNRSPARALEVRVRGWSRKEELATLRVIAAPLEMWRSVPEPLLPSFPVPQDGRAVIAVREAVRIRVIGEGIGSVWEVVPRGAFAFDALLRRNAIDAELAFRAHTGERAGRVHALAMTVRRGDAAPRTHAQFVSDGKGLMRIAALPESETITLFITSEASAPLTISGTASDLSRTIHLPAPAALRGQFVDETGTALEGVKVEAEGWVSPDAPAASRADATSDEKGRWVIRGLPRTTMIVRATVEAHATFQKTIVLDAEELDLGTVTLARAVELELAVADGEERPVVGARVESDSGFQGSTGKTGAVTVTRLPAAERTALTVTAPGFQKQIIELTPPLPKEERVVLDRAFSVTGTVSDDSGAFLDAVSVTVTIGAKYRRETVDAGGKFTFDVEPGDDFTLTFESPATASLTLAQSAGRAGESRDIGVVRLPAGLMVRGRVADPAGAPVAGARVWMIRPSSAGTVAAWVAGRIVQATTDLEGTFVLRGLSEGPAVLRIDAPDFARAYRDVVVEPSPTDLGTVILSRGRMVTVKVPRPEAVVARIDLRGAGLDADMLTAPVIEQQARLRQVPPGRYAVTVLDGRSIICHRTVDVAEGMDASVDCPPRMLISGRVFLGGIPAFGGTLIWSQPGQTDALVDNRYSPMGAMQQRVYGVGGGLVVVQVRPDGTFETDQLRPGEWQVGWRSADSVGTPERRIVVPDIAEPIVVAFEGGVIRGRVVDSDGRPVAAARVWEIQGPLHALAATDGTFTMVAVSAGVHRLQAMQGSRASRPVEVLVESVRELPETVLEIGDREENSLALHVADSDGRLIPNAFVFVEVLGGSVKTLMTDATGSARSSLADLPAVSRVAAYAGNAWAFGEFRRPSEGAPASHDATIRFTGTGSLSITSGSVTGVPSILSPAAPGDIVWMLGRMGSFLTLTPDAPLVIHGLPPGPYRVLVGEQSAVVKVTAESTNVVELP